MTKYLYILVDVSHSSQSGAFICDGLAPSPARPAHVLPPCVHAPNPCSPFPSPGAAGPAGGVRARGHRPRHPGPQRGAAAGGRPGAVVRRQRGAQHGLHGAGAGGVPGRQGGHQGAGVWWVAGAGEWMRGCARSMGSGGATDSAWEAVWRSETSRPRKVWLSTPQSICTTVTQQSKCRATIAMPHLLLLLTSVVCCSARPTRRCCLRCRWWASRTCSRWGTATTWRRPKRASWRKSRRSWRRRASRCVRL